MSEKAIPKRPNLFATVLTYPAPSANYRGESELNRSVIQKVTDGRWDYPIISPESIRSAMREILASYGLPSNRSRLPDEEQLAVKFADLPDYDKYVDDFFFGYLVAANGADRKKMRALVQEKRGKAAAEAFQFKRDSVVRMNLAKALSPYRHNAVFTQSPQDLTAKDLGRPANDSKSNLLHRETAVTPFQYPFALAWNDCKPKPEWTKSLLKAIGELNGVAGNHARSYFEMAPASIVVRLTPQLVAGYDTYGFRIERDPVDDQSHTHQYHEVIDGLLHEPSDYDVPGDFYIGGKIVKDLEAAHERAIAKFAQADSHAKLKTERPKTAYERLKAAGVTLDRDTRRLLTIVASNFTEGMA